MALKKCPNCGCDTFVDQERVVTKTISTLQGPRRQSRVHKYKACLKCGYIDSETNVKQFHTAN